MEKDNETILKDKDIKEQKEETASPDNIQNNITEEERKKYEYLAKIKLKKYGMWFISFFVLIFAVIMLFSIADKVYAGCAAFMSFMFVALSFIKYGKVKTIDDFTVLEVQCADKGRSGYRKQYFEYTFSYNNGDDYFVLKSAQKAKFKKGLKYKMCFAIDTKLSDENSLAKNLYHYENI